MLMDSHNSMQVSNIQSFDCNSNLALGNVSTSPEKLLSSALQSDTDTMFSHMRMVLAKIGKLYSSLFKKYLTVMKKATLFCFIIGNAIQCVFCAWFVSFK